MSAFLQRLKLPAMAAADRAMLAGFGTGFSLVLGLSFCIG
jgi:hypothetical protein